MKLSIIPIDGTVVKDGIPFIKLKFETCNIPSNINALQWNGHEGWIEDISPLVQNQKITELPDWANQCLVLWEEQFMSPEVIEELAMQDDAPLTNEQKLQLIRAERNNRLFASDWTQLQDSNVNKELWATYRQELRDLPENINDINMIIYPIPPK
jgi:hypothetical protein